MSGPPRHPGSRPRAGAAERAHAARLLHGVVVGRRTTDQVLGDGTASPLTRELVLGSLRHFFSLERAVNRALHRPLKPRDNDLWLLMIVGVHQLWHLRVPDHAAIFETVDACQHLGKPWARGLVNAVLRRCAGGEPADAGSFDHPDWLEAALRDAYPDAEAIMTADNGRAPMTLRINLRRTTPADYLAALAAAGISSRPPDAAGDPGASDVVPFGPETRVLDEPRPMNELPGYRDGLVSVQDAGAQLAAGLLEARAGERVLDACAAPGGKLFHLLERYPDARVTALEQSGPRLSQLGEQARRLGHDGTFAAVEGDGAGLDWWDGEPYRRVLLDAPCSGSGTLRRHPDIKVLRRREDLAPLVDLQGRLLANLWRVVEPGGTLLYCTCSILPAENDEAISRFLAHRPDALVSPFRLATGRSTRYGWQLLPTDADTDGFYYARMIKARP